MLLHLQKELDKAADPKKAKILQRFFKTGIGQYGEGDIFLGITVPAQRSIAKKYLQLQLQDIEQLLKSKIHEERLVALLILMDKYKKESDKGKKEVYDFYLEHTKYINNWDLVDLSARDIVGAYLYEYVIASGTKQSHKGETILSKLAISKNIWERRIAIVATYYFIQRNQLEQTFAIAEMLLQDNHDLIHKAVGWMLREVGKKDQKAEELFLKKYYKKMPRTMFRYAIERFPKALRLSFLHDSF